jgi:hypothetical protein
VSPAIAESARPHDTAKHTEMSVVSVLDGVGVGVLSVVDFREVVLWRR